MGGVMNQERDKLIVEYFGECWHELENFRCNKCNAKVYQLNEGHRDLSTWEGFGWLWGKMRKDEKLWERFLLWLIKDDRLCTYIALCVLIDDPDRLADAVYEFLKGRE
jgi:hypothetical protein